MTTGSVAVKFGDRPLDLNWGGGHVEYIRNMLSFSDTLKYADSGTA